MDSLGLLAGYLYRPAGLLLLGVHKFRQGASHKIHDLGKAFSRLSLPKFVHISLLVPNTQLTHS